MATTIRVDEKLHEKMKSLKQEKELSSYQELIEELLEKESERISMFGADEDLEKWKREDRLDLEDR